jgi:hypothetical protein
MTLKTFCVIHKIVLKEQEQIGTSVVHFRNRASLTIALKLTFRNGIKSFCYATIGDVMMKIEILAAILSQLATSMNPPPDMC